MTAMTSNKNLMRARHCVIVNNGDWYYNDNHDDNVFNNDDHVDDLRNGDGKTEPAAAAEAARAAEVGGALIKPTNSYF